MIIIGNMKSLNKAHDERWFIMRSMDWFYKDKNGGINERNYRLLMNPYTKIVNDLAPSKELFWIYMGLKKDNRWNMNSFNKMYVPRFLIELTNNPEAKERLNQLYYLDKQGKVILLICSCQEESLCHRSIIGGILAGVGCNVQSAFGTDVYNSYGHFYNEYRSTEKNEW